MLKFTATFTLLFAVCIALIRAQPYDDSELRAFLTPPEGCPAPCFMGIRPGVTTVDEAIAILEAHEWVESVTQNVNRDNLGEIYWQWSGKQSNWIDENQISLIWTTRNIVDLIALRTEFRLGDFWLSYPSPNFMRISGDVETGMPLVIYAGIYIDASILTSVVGICPIRTIWEQTVAVTFEDDFTNRRRYNFNLNNVIDDLPVQVALTCERTLRYFR